LAATAADIIWNNIYLYKEENDDNDGLGRASNWHSLDGPWKNVRLQEQQLQ